jgi:hypothetical protein
MSQTQNVLITGLFRDRASDTRAVATEKLQIGGIDIRFMCDALLQGSRFERVVQQQVPHDIWQLSFFLGSRFEHRIYVVRHYIEATQLSVERDRMYAALLQVLNARAENREIFDLGKLIWVEQLAPDEIAVKLVSQQLRNSHSLKNQDFSEQNGRFLALEARGIGMIAPEIHGDLHARHTVLLALARAYQNASTDAGSELSRLVAELDHNSTDRLLAKLYRHTLMFSARYYYARPVNLQTVDLHRIWEELRQINHLQSAHEELNEQLESVLRVLQHDDDRISQAQEQRNQRWLSVIGIFLAFLSLMSLVSITPDTVKQFWRSWTGP